MNSTGFLKSIPILLAAAACQANAAVISSSTVSNDPVFFDSSIASSLITTGQSSLLSVSGTTPSLGFPLGGVNNGSAVGFSGGTMNQSTLTFYENLGAPATITFQLNQGYNITSIKSLAGWGDTYFGSQLFSVALEIASSGIFVPLGNFGETPYTPVAPPGFPEVTDFGFSVLTTISDNGTGVIASNVTGVQFVFTDPYPGIPSLNGTVIRELSVFGTATVPETSSCLLIALGGIAMSSRRRRA